MGNREALLAAARECLLKKGYGNTTARDIAAESGVSLAAIGYHFGSRDALLYQALMDATETWARNIEEQLSLTRDPEAKLPEKFETAWTRVIESFEANWRLWAVTLESLPLLMEKPEMRRDFSDAVQQARKWLLNLFSLTIPPWDKESSQALGSLYYALLVGVLVQYLVDPERAPSGSDLASALRIAGGAVKSSERIASRRKQRSKQTRVRS